SISDAKPEVEESTKNDASPSLSSQAAQAFTQLDRKELRRLITTTRTTQTRVNKSKVLSAPQKPPDNQNKRKAVPRQTQQKTAVTSTSRG
ncbi:unnamed protein product, partial [Amoebophrya sp. A25]